MTEAPKHPIRAWRAARRVSLGELAGQVDASAATISRIERGKNKPSYDLLARLKAATGLSADEIMAAEAAE